MDISSEQLGQTTNSIGSIPTEEGYQLHSIQPTIPADVPAVSLGGTGTLFEQALETLTMASISDASPDILEQSGSFAVALGEQLDAVDITAPDALLGDLNEIATLLSTESPTMVSYLMAGLVDTARAAIQLSLTDPSAIDSILATFGQVLSDMEFAFFNQTDPEVTLKAGTAELERVFIGQKAQAAEVGIELDEIWLGNGATESAETIADPTTVAAETDISAADLAAATGLIDESSIAEAGNLFGETEEVTAGAASFDPLIGSDLGPVNTGTSSTSNTLSAEPSNNGDPSAQNQQILQDRFINLYISLMEKQISFKEAVEPFKTDNQNAGKG